MGDLEIKLYYIIDAEWMRLNYNAVYNYMSQHTISDTIKYFGEGIINIMIDSYIEQLLKDVGL